MISGVLLLVALLGAILFARWFVRAAMRIPEGPRAVLCVVLFPVAMVSSILLEGVTFFALVFPYALVASLAGGEMNVAIMEWLGM